MTEDQLAKEALGWLAEVGYAVHSGLDITQDGAHTQGSGKSITMTCFAVRDARASNG